MNKTVAELADLLGGVFEGDGSVEITGLASLLEATANELSFLGNSKYIPHVVESQAGVVLLPEGYAKDKKPGANYIFVADPSASFSTVVTLCAPAPIEFAPGVHPTAVVSPDVTIHASVYIGPNVVIEPGVVLGENCTIGAGCYVGHEVTLGADCFLHPNVTIRERCILANRVFIHSGTVVGSDGFGYIPGENGHVKVPQVGIVQLDDDVELGANVAIDRARFGRTWIKEGTKLDNLVHVAHNVVIGKYCFIVSQVGIAGSTVIEDRAILAGQVGVGGHLRIGAGTMVMGQSGVTKDLAAGAVVIGTPAMPIKEYSLNNLYIKKLRKFEKRLIELEKLV